MHHIGLCFPEPWSPQALKEPKLPPRPRITTKVHSTGQSLPMFLPVAAFLGPHMSTAREDVAMHAFLTVTQMANAAPPEIIV